MINELFSLSGIMFAVGEILQVADVRNRKFSYHSEIPATRHIPSDPLPTFCFWKQWLGCPRRVDDLFKYEGQAKSHGTIDW